MVLYKVSWSVDEVVADPAAPLVPDGAAAFDSSGQLLAVEVTGNRVRIINVKDRVPTGMLTAAVPSITAMAMRPGGQVALGAPDGTIVIQGGADGRVIKMMSTGTGSLSALAFSPDGMLLAAGDVNGNVVVFTVPSGEELRRAKTEGPVCAIAVPDSGAPLLLGGPDGYIGVHLRLLPPRGLVQSGSAVTALAFSQRTSGEPLVGRADGSIWRIDPLCQGLACWIADGDAPVRALWAGPRGQAMTLDGKGNLYGWLIEHVPPGILRKLPKEDWAAFDQLRGWAAELAAHVTQFSALHEQILDALAAGQANKVEHIDRIEEGERERIRPAVIESALSLVGSRAFDLAWETIVFLNPLPGIIAMSISSLVILLFGTTTLRAVGHLDGGSAWLTFAGISVGGLWLLWRLGRWGKGGLAARCFLVAVGVGTALAGPRGSAAGDVALTASHANIDLRASYPVWLAIVYMTVLTALPGLVKLLFRSARGTIAGTSVQPVPCASLLHALLDVAYQAQDITSRSERAVSPSARADLHRLIGQAAQIAGRQWISDLLTGVPEIDRVIRDEGRAIAASIKRWERQASLGGAGLLKLSEAFAEAVVNAADTDWEALAGDVIPPPRLRQQLWKLIKRAVGLAVLLGFAAGIFFGDRPLSASAGSVITVLLLVSAAQILRWLGLTQAIDSALSVSELFHKPN